VLADATGIGVAIDTGERAESRLLAKKSIWMTKRWRKWPDAPLAEIVADKLRRRVETGMQDPASAEARIERILRRLR
jgi:hypothetical protein